MRIKKSVKNSARIGDKGRRNSVNVPYIHTYILGVRKSSWRFSPLDVTGKMPRTFS